MADVTHDLDLQAPANIEAQETAEYLGAFNFGRSVQRVEDNQAAEDRHAYVMLVEVFCIFLGFIMGLLTAGALHWLHRG